MDTWDAEMDRDFRGVPEQAVIRVTPTPTFIEIAVLDGGAILVNADGVQMRLEPGRKLLVFGEPPATTP